MNLKKLLLIKKTNKFLLLLLIISTIVFASLENKSTTIGNNVSIKSTPNSHVTLDFSHVNAESWDAFSDSNNMIGNCFDGDVVTGIEWSNLTFETVENSLLSEIEFALSDSSQNNQVVFAPANGDNNSGVGIYSSGSVIDLTDQGMQDINSLVDNHFLIGFYESLDNLPDNIDARITSGTIDIWGINLIKSEDCPFNVNSLATGQINFDIISLRNLAHVSIILSDGITLEIDRIKLDNTSSTQYTWKGIVENYPESFITISINNGDAIGFLKFNFRHFEIQMSETQTPSVTEIDLSIIDVEDDTIGLFDNIFKNGFENQNQSTNKVKNSGTCGDNPWQIDIMFVFSPNEIITPSIASNRAINAIEYANKVYKDSGIVIDGNYVELKLVHIAEVSAQDIDDSSHLTTLTRLAERDSYMEEVLLLRDQYKADIVILFDEFINVQSNIRGRARSVSPTPNAIDAFAVLTITNNMEEFFIHEISHLFGAWHDTYTINKTCRENVPSLSPSLSLSDCITAVGGSLNKNNFGYTLFDDESFFWDKGYYTVMSYSWECDSGFTRPPNYCKKVGRFSSINQVYGDNNIPIGSTDTHSDNVTQIISATPIVACHRDSTTTAPPLLVTINQALTQVDPTIGDYAFFEVEFSRSINSNSLELNDFIVIPSGIVDTIELIPDSNSKRFSIRVAFLNQSDGDTFSVFLPESMVQDDTGMVNHASTSIDNQVTYNIPSIIIARPLNDTGIIGGGDYPSGNNITCTSNIVSLQDCYQGRDFIHNDNSDGHAGFSFTKLDADGNSLLASASNWSCVKDNVTGLIWEVKTNDGGIHDKDNGYRWGGITRLGNDFGIYFDDWNSLVNGSNSANFCGKNNWIVPDRSALESILNLNSFPSSNTDYFPYLDSFVWSSTPSARSSGSASGVYFDSGDSSTNQRHLGAPVYLVNLNKTL